MKKDKGWTTQYDKVWPGLDMTGNHIQLTRYQFQVLTNERDFYRAMYEATRDELMRVTTNALSKETLDK